MNIRRFVAVDSRSALRQVRETLGGDAVILANRSIDGGVEVLAALPEDVDALTRRVVEPAPLQAAATPAVPAKAPAATPTHAETNAATAHRSRLASLFARRTAASEPKAETAAETEWLASRMPTTTAVAQDQAGDDFASALLASDQADAVVANLAPAAVALSKPRAEPVRTGEAAVVPLAPAPMALVPRAAAAIEPIVVAPIASSEPSVSQAELSELVAREVRGEVSREISRELGRDMIDDLKRDVSRAVSIDVARELQAMQASLAEQLSTFAWTDAMRRQPGRTKLMQDLIRAGFSPSLARHIQARLPDDFNDPEARDWAQAVLRRNLPVASDVDELLAEGGVYALVGPTGVGKTTTVAKLAARFALRHGVDKLALISTDGYRIGAQDQLRIYGKILGIPVHSIHDQASLTSAIGHLADKKLVLIDTAGLGQRDERVAEQIAMLRGAKARRLVVLNATADAETLDHVVATFADKEFGGCVITKSDEAARLGPVLDAVIRHRLAIHYVSTGQKVPEDLERPDAMRLVGDALKRSSTRPAFDVKADDEPVWMSAMTEGARTLDGLSFDTGAVHA